MNNPTNEPKDQNRELLLAKMRGCLGEDWIVKFCISPLSLNRTAGFNAALAQARQSMPAVLEVVAKEMFNHLEEVSKTAYSQEDEYTISQFLNRFFNLRGK